MRRRERTRTPAGLVANERSGDAAAPAASVKSVSVIAPKAGSAVIEGSSSRATVGAPCDASASRLRSAWFGRRVFERSGAPVSGESGAAPRPRLLECRSQASIAERS